MLKYRLITAFVLAPLIIWGLFKLPETAFAVILGLIVLQGVWEWTRIIGIGAIVLRIAYLIALLAMLVFFWQSTLFNTQILQLTLLMALCWWVACIYILYAYSRGRDYIDQHVFIKALIGMVILLPLFVAITTLRFDDRFGPGYVLFLLLLIWIADSAAYFSGRQWGKRKLLPKVSPGKTWEGVAGAMVAIIATAVVGGYFFELESIDIILFVALCIVTTVFSIVGDLNESLFKRQAHLKDSGHLLPGHGGMLDRIDSMTSAAPVFLTGLLLLKG